MLNEVLASVVSGRPIWRESLERCLTVPKDEASLAPHLAVQQFINWTDKAKVSYLHMIANEFQQLLLLSAFLYALPNLCVSCLLA